MKKIENPVIIKEVIYIRRDIWLTQLYFVRHGKTQWNLESRYQGAGGDSPLLKESYDEMNLLAKHFSKVPFAHVYASPIKRARITARVITEQLRGKPGLSLLSRLEEFHLGKMEGMKFDVVKEKYPAEFENFRNHPDLYDPTEIGGESFSDVINRMTPAIQMIVRNNPGKDVLIVSHGAALNAEINSLLGTSLPDLRKRGGLANTSTTILQTKDNGRTYQLVKWNDTSYLNRPIDPTDVV